MRPFAHRTSAHLRSVLVVVSIGFAMLAIPPPLANAQATGLPTPPLLVGLDVRCLYQDYVGFAWLCTNAGILRFDGRRQVTFANGTSDLRAILRGSRGGQYWVGAASGLYQMRSNDAAAGTVRLERVVAERPIAAVNGLVEFVEGAIGCATDDGALRLADGKVTEIPLGLPDERAGRIVHVLLQPDTDFLLAGTSSGLYLQRRGRGTKRFTTDDGLPDNDVQAVAVTLGGRIWIGTRRGLATITLEDLQAESPRPVRVFSDLDGLRNADIRDLRVVDGTSLWVGASTGLVAIRIARGKAPQAVQAVQIDDAAVRMFSHGGTDLLVASDDGVSVVRNGLGGGMAVITGITVDGRAEPISFEGTKDARVALPWNARLVEIYFVQPHVEIVDFFGRMTGLSTYLIRTGAVRDGVFSDIPPSWTMLRTADDGRIHGDIFVRLTRDFRSLRRNATDPLDVSPVVLRRSQDEGPPSSFASTHVATADTTGWLRLPDEAERRIIIENPAQTLAAGLHRVVVYASASPGRGGDSASVAFVVGAAPWVRWWFVGPLLLAMTAAVVAYRRRGDRQEKEIARLRTRIAADLHDSVGASLSRIAILSDVVARQVGAQMPTAGPSLKAIGDNARSVMDEMNDAVWFIDPDIRHVRDMLVRIRTVAAQLFEPDHVAWSVDAEDQALNVALTSEQRRHVYLLVKEALTNVRRHADPSFVAVRISMAATGLHIEIDDDGATTKPGPSERSGNGIANMRARAAELGGALIVDARVPAPGTRVVVQTSLR